MHRSESCGVPFTGFRRLLNNAETVLNVIRVTRGREKAINGEYGVSQMPKPANGLAVTRQDSAPPLCILENS